jgi:hypothetical protein
MQSAHHVQHSGRMAKCVNLSPNKGRDFVFRHDILAGNGTHAVTCPMHTRDHFTGSKTDGDLHGIGIRKTFTAILQYI